MTTKLGVRWGVKPPLLSGQPKEILRANRVIEQIEDINRGLVAYYNDDGKSAATWQDMVNYPNGKNNGTIYGATTPPPATPGALGYTFDGVDDYVNAGNDASLINSLTISAWINPSSLTGERRIVNKRAAASGYFLETDGAYPLFAGFDGVDYSWAQSTEAIELNKWTFVTGIIIGNTAYIYVNGVFKKATTNVNVVNITNTRSVYIGHDEATNWFNGSIDEVRIFNRTLSAGEIIKLFNQYRGKFGI